MLLKCKIMFIVFLKLKIEGIKFINDIKTNKIKVMPLDSNNTVLQLCKDLLMISFFLCTHTNAHTHTHSHTLTQLHTHAHAHTHKHTHIRTHLYIYI